MIHSGHREFVSDTAFDYYGKRLVSASADGYLRIWNLINKEWKLQTEIKAHSSLISRVDWAHPVFGQIFAYVLRTVLSIFTNHKMYFSSGRGKMTPPS